MFKHNEKIDWLAIASLLVALLVALGLTLATEYQPSPQGGNQGQDAKCFSEGMAVPCGGWVHRNHEDIEAASTFFVALFTIVLAVFTIRLASATDRLVKGSENTAKRQLRAY